MGQQKLERTLRKELELLNKKIDLKIVWGFPYAREARRHKFLLSQFTQMDKVTRREKVRSNWLGRSMSFVSSFVL